MRTIVHLSDLHFGREDRRVVAALPGAIAALAPDVIAVSGDLTQRARRTQFQQARAFLDALAFPRIVVPGNHDVPLYNVWARAFRPLASYRHYITGDLQPAFGDDLLWIAGVNTTRPSRWKSGHIPGGALQHLHAALASADAAAIKVLVAHHPFDAPHGAAAPTLTGLAGAGIDVFLTGHLHATYAGHTAHRYRAAGRTAVVVEAGTAASTRIRGETNAFNVVRVTRDTITVETHGWNRTSFAPITAQQFQRASDGWMTAGT